MMPYTYGVLGAGRQGTAAAYDMARWGDAKRVVLLDNLIIPFFMVRLGVNAGDLTIHHGKERSIHSGIKIPNRTCNKNIPMVTLSYS